MTAPVWVHELADRFWSAAGGAPNGFPRDLGYPISLAFPLTTVSLLELRVRSVESWLERQAISCRLPRRDRALRACLVAHGGVGALFLDGADPTEEQRFSLAHELAHFLRDYLEPRHRAVDAFGPGVLQVFDGVRPPTRQERVSALLADVPIGFHVHLMERHPGGWRDDDVGAAEGAADRLALELLAPEDAVRVDLAALPASDRFGKAERLLRHRYGLPSGPAHYYASRLLPRTPSSPFLQMLRGRR